jgi:hypothetical protein
VFPLAPRAKTPIIENGVHGTTRDLAEIEAWWRRTPEANVAVATGTRSGFWALDLDEKRGGCEWRREQERIRGDLPVTPIQLTGGGGEHYLFSLPRHVEIRNRVAIAPGVDVRGEGGYIVVAPSIHPNGRGYFWEACRHPLETPVASAPEWLVDLVVKREGTGRTTPEEWVRLLQEGVDEGSRNDSVARLAGHLLRHGIDPLVALELLRAWNFQNCRPPLNESEVASVVDSIARAEARRLDRGERR